MALVVTTIVVKTAISGATEVATTAFAKLQLHFTTSGGHNLPASSFLLGPHGYGSITLHGHVAHRHGGTRPPSVR